MFSLDEDDVALETFDGSAPTALEDPALLDTAAIMFTSGTTSTPKGVVITQANYAFGGRNHGCRRRFGSRRPPVGGIATLPRQCPVLLLRLRHCGGRQRRADKQVFASRFTAQAARHAATHASLFAAPMRMILARGALVARPQVAPRLVYPEHDPASSIGRSARFSGAGRGSSTA